MYALKVATEVLRKGGTFVTKVFRSKDYNALMYIANQFFTKVESNKPQSSRSTSAEIFMVCTGYKAPDVIDPKLLDPKYALEQVEDDPTDRNNQKVTSLKKLLNQKVNRGGYADGVNQLFTECDLVDFLTASEPHEYLSSFNRFKIDDTAKGMLADIKVPSDLETICGDLKLCGRREFQELLKLRYKLNVSVQRKKKEIKEIKAQQQQEHEPT